MKFLKFRAYDVSNTNEQEENVIYLNVSDLEKIEVFENEVYASALDYQYLLKKFSTSDEAKSFAKQLILKILYGNEDLIDTDKILVSAMAAQK